MGSENGVAAVSVFDPELMVEEFKVGDRVFVMNPLKLKHYRQLAGLIDETIIKFSQLDKDARLPVVMDMILKRDMAIVRLLCPLDELILTDDFIEDNMTAAGLRCIVSRGITMNRLDVVYPFLVDRTPEPVPSPEKWV